MEQSWILILLKKTTSWQPFVKENPAFALGVKRWLFRMFFNKLEINSFWSRIGAPVDANDPILIWSWQVTLIKDHPICSIYLSIYSLIYQVVYLVIYMFIYVYIVEYIHQSIIIYNYICLLEIHPEIQHNTTIFFLNNAFNEILLPGTLLHFDLSFDAKVKWLLQGLRCDLFSQVPDASDACAFWLATTMCHFGFKIKTCQHKAQCWNLNFKKNAFFCDGKRSCIKNVVIFGTKRNRFDMFQTWKGPWSESSIKIEHKPTL